MKMTRINSYDDMASWIDQRTNEISKLKYEKNHQHLLQGIKEQTQLSIDVAEMEAKVNQVLSRTYDGVKKKQLIDSYEMLKSLIRKKLHCLETMLQVAALEENCSNISRDFDLRAVSLVKSEKVCMTEDGAQRSDSVSSSASAGSSIAGFISTSAQDCINGLRSNWDWIMKLVKCVNVHLKNSSEYQQFFHEIQETGPWMFEEFNQLSKTFDSHSLKTGNDDIKKVSTDLDSVYVVLRQWEAKINRLWNTGSTLYPVSLRTDGITGPTPARSLCDYETKDISFAAGEDLLLLDNSNPDLWKVRNGKGNEAEVPPVIILIQGPCKEAIETATKFQLQLLTAWTNALKRIGVRLLCHMLTFFKPEYNTTEIAALSSMEDIDKDHLLQLLTHIEDSLRKYWSDHEGFISLQERLLSLRMALEEIGDSEGDQKDAGFYQSIIVETTALGQIMNVYQDMFRDWEKFKVAVESSQAPELMLIVDKWEQLQFVSREYFSKFWKLKLPLNERERSILRAKNFTLEGVPFEDTIAMLSPLQISARMSEESVDAFHKPATKVARKLNMEEKSGYSDEVFHADKTTLSAAASVVQAHNWDVADDNLKDETPTGQQAEIKMQKMFGRSAVNEAGLRQEELKENGTWATTTQLMANLGKAKESKDNEYHQLSRKINADDILIGETNRAMESLSEETTGSEYRDTITKDSITYGRAMIDTNKFNGKESLAKTVRRLQSSQTSASEEEVFEELTEMDFKHLNRLSSSEYEGTRFGIATETKTAETEQLCSAEMEEKKTFVVRSVVNPNDQTDISLQQAIMLGVIRPNEGVYIDSVKSTVLPIATAMSDGLIKVMFTTTKRTPEKFSSIGIITVKTVRKLARPCIIVSVRDSLTDEDISHEEAHQRDLLDEQQGFYKDHVTGKKMMIAEAVDKGLMTVEFCGEQPEPEVISKTYAVRAVVDRRLRKTVTFHEAVRRGIIDKDSGAFRDTITNEKMYVGDAIMRGFLKARIIEDAHGLNIDPENKMVIDKTQKIRERLLKPLKVISAFKMAAKDSTKK